MSERTATTWAWWASAAVALLGLILVVVPAVVHADLGDPYGPRRVVTEKVTTDPDGKVSTERVTAEDDTSWPERALGPGGLFILRLGAVVLAAFLAGAVTQRTLLGKFAFKAGSIEVPDVTVAADATEGALFDLLARLDDQKELATKALRAAARAQRAVQDLEDRLDAER